MKVRQAKLEDAKGIATVHVDSWRSTYQGIVAQSYLDSLSYSAREELWHTAIPYGHVFVAENEQGKIVGFVTASKERSGNYPDYQGELTAIYILAEYQGQGIGKALMQHTVRYLQMQGFESMLVLVLEDNPATAFYKAIGGEKIDVVEIEIGGERLQEAVYGWRTLPQNGDLE
ncbi:GNAT family N-acetyltransferase [Metasolibacillus meyeri]|uniref:GNAT family N-acetyltransferase n=1 Tax=Metasolibacillus meyeri TaxID=1071052 RepID=UPI000D30C395|nr:GNAT family N-acetyltransferase [Metasolibacillus meyeri]